jgi:hypothetical protein
VTGATGGRRMPRGNDNGDDFAAPGSFRGCAAQATGLPVRPQGSLPRSHARRPAAAPDPRASAAPGRKRREPGQGLPTGRATHPQDHTNGRIRLFKDDVEAEVVAQSAVWAGPPQLKARTLWGVSECVST